MKSITLLERLRTMPIVTTNDLAKLSGLGPASVRMMSWRLSKQGLIKKIERGKYSTIKNPVVIADYLVQPSYLGLYSALRFHQLTTQIVNDIDIIVPKIRKPALIGDRRIEFTKTKQFWGFQKYRIDDFEILVSDPEKTIIDCLLSEKVRIHIIFEALTEIDQEKLFSYAKRTNNLALGKRLGFLLSKAGHRSEEYKIFAHGNYIKLDPKNPEKGLKNKKWKIIENVAIE